MNLEPPRDFVCRKIVPISVGAPIGATAASRSHLLLAVVEPRKCHPGAAASAIVLDQ